MRWNRCDSSLAYINGTEYFYTKPELILEIALKGVFNTVEAALKNNIGQYWLMSSGEVYQDPGQVPTSEKVELKVPDPLNARYSYGGGKIISELYALNFV
jgi:nucleoside-diphosphate-sugar epimerase